MCIHTYINVPVYIYLCVYIVTLISHFYVCVKGVCKRQPVT